MCVRLCSTESLHFKLEMWVLKDGGRRIMEDVIQLNHGKRVWSSVFVRFQLIGFSKSKTESLEKLFKSREQFKTYSQLLVWSGRKMSLGKFRSNEIGKKNDWIQHTHFIYLLNTPKALTCHGRLEKKRVFKLVNKWSNRRVVHGWIAAAIACK